MITNEPSALVLQEAAAWLVRAEGLRDSETLSRFDEWLSRSGEHRAAYAEALATWHGLAAVRPERNARPTFRVSTGARARWALVLALGLLIAAVLDVRPAWLADHATAPGEISTLLLDDGSELVLGTDSAVDVALDQHARVLELRSGIVRIDVAPDPHRPLSVTSNGVRVMAIGTRFAVEKRSGARTTVLVEHGRVEVSGEGTTDPIMLNAGQQLVIEPGRPPRPETLDPRMLGWTEGVILFDGQTLSSALAELDGWIVGRVVCRAQCDLPVRGAFAAAQARDAVRSIAAQRNLRVREYPYLIVVGP